MSKEHRYPIDLYVLIISSLFIFLAVETTRPIIPLYVTELGASPIELGLIVGLLSFSLMMLMIPLGIISERFSSIYVIFLGVFGQSLSQFCYSIAPSPVFFYPIQVLHAISTAALIPMAISISQNLAPKGKTGEIMGVYLTSYGLANSIGPYLCSYLLTFMTYRQIFQTAALIPLLGLLPLLVVKKTQSLLLPTNAQRTNPLVSLTNLTHSRDLLILAFLRFSFAITYSFYIIFFVIYAENILLLAPSLVVFILGTRGLSDTLLRIPAGRLVDKVDYKWCILTSIGVLSVVYLLITVITSFFYLLVLITVFGLAIGLRLVAEYTMLADKCDATARNIAAAYLSTMFNVGSTVGAVLAGIIVSVANFTLLFRSASVLMCIAFIFALGISRKSSQTMRIIEYE